MAEISALQQHRHHHPIPAAWYDSGCEIKDKVYTARPNLDAIRYELGKEGKEGSKAVWENTGLIPKYYKPYSLIETAEKNNPAPIYRCNFCKLIYKGHNSIVYHCRRHIGDYPYKCQDCGFYEVCKSGLSSHMRRTGHKNCAKIDGPDRLLKTTTPTQKITTQPQPDEFASERIKDRRFNMTPLAQMCRFIPHPPIEQQQHQQQQQLLEVVEDRSDSPKSIESGSADSGMNIDGVVDQTGSMKSWEATEQRMNTDPPPLPLECQSRVCPDNVGLIPKYLKPFTPIRGDNGKQIYVCNYCRGEFRGHNSIVYHTRRHIGDYPYRCGTCGYAEVSKCALNQHLLNHRHQGAILLRYTRDPAKSMDQIAEQIQLDVARPKTSSPSHEQQHDQPNAKRAKLDYSLSSVNDIVQRIDDNDDDVIHITTATDSDSAISEGEPDSNDELGPNIKLMLWHAKQRNIGEKKIDKSTSNWKFCARCQSGFLCNDMFDAHIC